MAETSTQACATPPAHLRAWRMRGTPSFLEQRPARQPAPPLRLTWELGALSIAEASTPACANPTTHLGAWSMRIITPTFSMAEASTPAHAPPSPTHLRVRYMRSIPPCSLRRRPARYPALPIRLTWEPGACVVVPHALYGGGQHACQHTHHSLHWHCRGPPLDWILKEELWTKF